MNNKDIYTNPIQIKVNQTVDFIVGNCVPSNIRFYNKQGEFVQITKKPQYRCLINNKIKYLPLHQELVDFLHTVPKGTRVQATRCTQGNNHQTARYICKIIKEDY